MRRALLIAAAASLVAAPAAEAKPRGSNAKRAAPAVAKRFASKRATSACVAKRRRSACVSGWRAKPSALAVTTVSRGVSGTSCRFAAKGATPSPHRLFTARWRFRSWRRTVPAGTHVRVRRRRKPSTSSAIAPSHGDGSQAGEGAGGGAGGRTGSGSPAGTTGASTGGAGAGGGGVAAAGRPTVSAERQPRAADAGDAPFAVRFAANRGDFGADRFASAGAATTSATPSRSASDLT